MKILVIGVGYVGLVTGTCLAEVGHDVLCLDISEKKIRDLEKGILPIYEMGLEEMVKRNVFEGRLHFTTDYGCIQDRECIFIAVNTPQSPQGDADLSAVWDVAHTLGPKIHPGQVVVTKSTVPPGTTHRVEALLRQGSATPDQVLVCNNPEFLKEGCAIADFMKPDRVVVGVSNPQTERVMAKIYAPFMLNRKRFCVMDIVSSELTKYAANAMLATRISFMNEMARIATACGADIEHVRLGMGSDERIGHAFLYPGCGYGGSCLPKDVQALMATSRKHHVETPLLQAVERVNEEQKVLLFKKVVETFGNDLSRRCFGLWGLSFKPYTDDMRCAPSLELIRELIKAGAKVRLFDPIAQHNAKKLLADHPRITFVSSEIEAASGADAIMLITEWKQFRLVDLERVHGLMRSTYFFDGRNQYDPEEMEQLGFTYQCIGRSLRGHTHPTHMAIPTC